MHLDVDAINRDPLFYKTPIGRLRLERHGVGANERVVVLLCPHGRFDPRAPARVVKRLAPTDQIMDVVLGKQFWEQADVLAAYLKHEDRTQAALEADSRQASVDFRANMATARRRLGTEGLLQAMHDVFSGAA